MSSTSFALPRGLVPGACFAVLLAAPLFLAISLDSSAPSFSSHFRFGSSNLARQRPASSTAEFFDRQVGVQVFVGFRPAIPATPTGKHATNFFGFSDRADSARPRPQKFFQIRIENRSDKEISIDVLEAKSEFADLSSGLQNLRLAPGQMTQTGVALKENVAPTKPSPVQVTLRFGDREEKHSLMLAPLVPL